MDELWKAVSGYEGLYEVSNLGRVRSLARVAYRRDGTKLSLKGGIKRLTDNGAGYFHTRLTKDGKSDNILVHVMVARAFVENPDGLPDVNHKDLNPKNCCHSNLEWVTHKQNINHARDAGRLHGYTNVNRRLKLDPESVASVREAVARGEAHVRIASRHGVSRRMIGMIKNNSRWNVAFSPEQFGQGVSQ